MTQRCIAHVDMDAFYASIEIRDNPSLAGKPVVVGGSSEGRGVVSAASYEARKYGIHSAMSMARAERLCSTLIRVPPSFGKYTDASRKIMAVLHRFSPLVEPLSLDEAFLDLTGTERALGPPEEVGREIKRQVREATRLTASVGIAPAKFVAKIASDLEKPDGLTVVPPGGVEAFLRPLPISRLWGVGPRTREALESLGIRTIGDIADCDPKRLESRFGEHGRHLSDLAWGIDGRTVIPEEEAKSYSHEETFPRDVSDPEMLESVLLSQAIRVSRRLRMDGVVGKVVQIKLRYEDFQTLTRRRTLGTSTADEARIFETGRMLFRANWNRRPVRLIGIGVSAVAEEETINLDLFQPPEIEGRRRRLAETIDRIEDRFGEGRVTRARLVRSELGKGKPELAERPVRERPQGPGPGRSRERLVSEPLKPLEGTFETRGMAQGTPGLPEGFHWKKQTVRIVECVAVWKQARPEGGSGELYVRRHYYRLRMDDGAVWVVYCLRQAPRQGPARQRWFLYKVEERQ